MIDISAAAPARQVEIAGFLSNAFGTDVPAGFCNAEFLAWKFFQPHPIWKGSRSYIVEQDGGIVAHACVWPVPFRCGHTQIPCTHLIDWVASPSSPGSGIAVYRKLMQISGRVLAIGGSDQARRVLPKIGFQPFGFVGRYARVVRPWRQYRTRPVQGGWLRGAARFGRNAVWSFQRRPAAPVEWSAGQMSKPSSELDDFLRDIQPGSYSSGHRSGAILQFIMSCPLAPARLFVIRHRSVLRGYFLLNRVAGQCRIIDLQMDSASPDDWRLAYRLALETAGGERETCEVVTFASIPSIGSVLREEGFHRRDERAVMLFDPAGTLSAAAPVHLQMVDSDAFFLSSTTHPYLT